jgi:hypothetical protein
MVQWSPNLVVFLAMGSKLISFFFNKYLDLAMVFGGDLFSLLHGVVLLSLHEVVVVICCDGICGSSGEVLMVSRQHKKTVIPGQLVKT